MTIKVSPENEKFITANGNKIGENWYYFPFWWKRLGDGIFEQVPFEKLPKEVKDLIQERREP